MLQRTNADQVEPVWNEFCKKYITPKDYSSDEEVRIFDSLGLHWREKELRKLAEVLVDSQIPSDKEKLFQ